MHPDPSSLLEVDASGARPFISFTPIFAPSQLGAQASASDKPCLLKFTPPAFVFFVRIIQVPCPQICPRHYPQVKWQDRWKVSRGRSWAFLGSFEETTFRGMHAVCAHVPGPVVGIFHRDFLGHEGSRLSPALIPPGGPLPRSAQPFVTTQALGQDYL